MLNPTELTKVHPDSLKLKAQDYYGVLLKGWELTLLFAIKLGIRYTEDRETVFFHDDNIRIEGGLAEYFMQIDAVLDFIPTLLPIQNVHPVGMFVENLFQLSDYDYKNNEKVIKQIFSKMFAKIPPEVDVVEIIFSRSEEWQCENYLDQEFIWLFNNCLCNRQLDHFKLASRSAELGMQDVVVEVINKSKFELSQILQLKDILYTNAEFIAEEVDDFFINCTNHNVSNKTMVL